MKPAASFTTRRQLDLDYFSAKVDQQASRDRSSEVLGYVDDPDAFENSPVESHSVTKPLS